MPVRKKIVSHSWNILTYYCFWSKAPMIIYPSIVHLCTHPFRNEDGLCEGQWSADHHGPRQLKHTLTCTSTKQYLFKKQFKNSSFVNILQKSVSFYLVVSAINSCRTNQLHYCFSFTEKYKSTLVHIKSPHIRFELKRHSLQTIQQKTLHFQPSRQLPGCTQLN